jgi:protein SCO1/2
MTSPHWQQTAPYGSARSDGARPWRCVPSPAVHAMVPIPRRRAPRSASGARLVRFLLSIVLLAPLVAPAPAAGHELAPGGLSNVGFDQHPGAQVPLDLPFHDEMGQPVTLGAYFGSRPVLLTMNYLNCPNLCPLILEGLGAGLAGVPFELGRQFDVVTVSIDPRDGPALAKMMKLRAVNAYGHPDDAAGWHVLTGNHETIDQLAAAVGFNYAYDPEQDDYAHPAGVIALTPEGRVSRYLYGMDFPATDLRLALVEAGQRRIGTIVDRVLLVCYHYEATTGRYTPIILETLRWVGAATVLGLGGFIWLLWRGEARRSREPTVGGG